MTKTLLPFLFLLSLGASAQETSIDAHGWDDTPRIPDSLRQGAGSTLILQRNNLNEVYQREGKYVNRAVFHLQRLIRDSEGIASNATVQYDLAGPTQLLEIRARTINQDGTVRVLPEEAFKHLETEEGGRAVRFAFEGVGPGSVVEYIVRTDQAFEHRGQRVNLQFPTTVVDQRWVLVVPRTWQVDVKGYNGVPPVEVDSSLAGRVRFQVHMSGVPGLEEEPDAYPQANAAFLIHRLTQVEGGDERDLSSFRTLLRSYHPRLYPELSKKEIKALDARLEAMNLSFARDLEDKVRTIEDHVKSRFRLIRNGSDPALSDLSQVLSERSFNELGMMKLYCSLFRRAGIEHQLVITSSKRTEPFDPSFECIVYLQDQHFHFPGIKKFLSPSSYDLRLGYLPSRNMGTKGLFVRNVEVGGAFQGLGSVKDIPLPPDSANMQALELRIGLSDDCFEARIELEDEVTGYMAGALQMFYEHMDDKERREAMEPLLSHLLHQSSSSTITAEHTGADQFGRTPLLLKGSVVTSNFNSLAGTKVLFRVGELLAPGVEPITATSRVLPIDEGFPSRSHRRIRITVPAGWTVDGLEALNLRRTMMHQGREALLFESKAVQEGNDVVIEVTEVHAECHFPVGAFEEHKTFVNAVAELRTKALVLSPRN